MWKTTFGIWTALAFLATAEVPPTAVPPTAVQSTAVIFSGEKPVCTGGIVGIGSQDRLFIVTAAHCVYTNSPSQLRVRIGSPDSESESKSYVVSSVSVHPYFTPPSSDYDVAVLKTKSSSANNITTTTPEPSPEPSTFAVLKLSTKEPKSSDVVNLITWDLKGENKSLTSVESNVEDRKSCKGKLAGKVTVTGRMICVSSDATSLPGGGPVLVKDEIAGVVSYDRSNLKNLPRVCANIANPEIYSFIERLI